MPYTEEDGGRLNNFAVEPRMYTAEPPTKKQQRNYLVFGVLALLLLGGVVSVAVFASNAG
ncbi:hypothetical protein STA3757_43940 [Stanieria sp. NIES-3757]|nr:hypothetical protein STA3757_43940 [Stanieria sp. NIES-3757]